MKKLFLCSSFKDAVPLFVSLGLDLKGKSVTFIPTAGNVEKIVFYISSGKKELEKLGLTVDVLDVAANTSAQIEASLAKNDFIYVSGGNTFYLLQELKKCNAAQCIINQVAAGKLYIGESAGAMAASPDIAYAAAMDSVKKAPDLETTSALSLSDFYTVPHCANPPFKKAAEKIIATYGSSQNLTPISNRQAIWVDGNEITVMGDQ